MISDTHLSVVILCYRSEESVIEFVRQTREVIGSLATAYELVLVGNYVEGSDDRTAAIVEGLAAGDEKIKAVCKPKEGMMGWDMREGLAVATGDYICVIDGDGQFPMESLVTAYQMIRSGDYDLVKSYRISRDDGQWRKFISVVYNGLFNLLFPGLTVRDINSKPKIMTKRALQQMDLHSDDWFIDAEIMLMVRKLGLRVGEFPIEFKELQGRKSFIQPRAIWEFMNNMIAYRFKRK